ncbi:hypothetical protein [Streptomyces sp. NPDC056948]|uniref:hypothetical protein n=1 Tax=Streptomyces sp. NPDC056948 TaxID=3345975 RepID=UPI00363DC9B2
MNVEIPPQVRDTATHLGAGVAYALKVLAGQLADEPDMGEPSGLPGILTVTVDGDVFEDCPALAIGYIREPDRIEIRYVNPALSAEPVADDEDQDEHEYVGAGQYRLPQQITRQVPAGVQDHAAGLRGEPMTARSPSQPAHCSSRSLP